MKYDATAPRFSGFLWQISMFLAVYCILKVQEVITNHKTLNINVDEALIAIFI